MTDIKTGPLTVKAFQKATGVSEAVLARLQAYVALLGKWQAKINLVGKDSLNDVWRRHILDSAQLQPLLPVTAVTVADIGSGAGLPGLVLAIMKAPGGPEFHLIESNARKCAFLRQASRLTEAGAIIHHTRAESLKNFKADFVVARGVSPLEKLLNTVKPLLKEGGQCLFLKGKKWREELTETQKKWIINESAIQSLSDPSGMVIKLEGITRRE